MKISQTRLPDLLVIEPKRFHDQRGYFFELHRQDTYAQLGLPTFVQDNYSYSKKNVLRGLHYQLPNTQGKLVTVLQGEVFDVAVDIRRSSPTYRQWFGITLNDQNHAELYIPPGFAHGFCVLSEVAIFLYKCTDFYTPAAEHGILWNDATIGIDWPVKNPVLSAKDAAYPTLSEIDNEHLFA